jgi:DNA-binding MarR family transcriptional regulator
LVLARSDLDADVRLAALGSLRRLSAAIDQLDGAAAERYGLNRTDMRALDLVGQARSLAPTELARRLGVTTAGTTTVIDRLEAAGYVRRRPDPVDRRRLAIEPTEYTDRQDADTFGGLMRATLDLLGGCGDEDVIAIRDFLDAMAALTVDYAATLAETHNAGVAIVDTEGRS